MKKTLLLVVMAIIATTMTAGNVTPQQALEAAKQFVVKHMAKRSSTTAVPQLQEAGKVSGLYVFNLAGRKGYVVVSNDDRTAAILGYSNSGSLNPADMPDNMRAWLQGYADEIAWMQAHPDRVVTLPQARRAGEVKTPIAPLIATRWNQGAPYSDQTPYYGIEGGYYIYSTTAKDGYKHCVTGCVATAMAQVMKYHEWPTAATTAIPSYSWQGNTLGPLPAVTFDWANMLNVYSEGTYTSAQATAVATLMQYCGYSVQMEYGPSSGAITNDVADALKNYFDYNAETTQFVDRNDYSYDNWIDMLYNELRQGRPVVYGGSSAGGGHEFVCDGYQGEDYFHINWGWGGQSDDYFKLSALNPYTQGIGGSSSSDGFHFGQDAVVGIQKSGETGTVVSEKAADYNLTLNSLTIDKATATVGESVAITANITNNSSEPYDADIILVDKGGNFMLYGQTFYIGAGETKNCVINYTPAETGTFKYSVVHGRRYYIDYDKEVTLTVTAGSNNPTSDNITLGRALTVENAELISGKSYNVYGTTFNGTLTVSNPDATYDYYGAYQIDLYKDYDFDNPVARVAQLITVPANGSINIPIVFDGMVNGSMYEVDVIYQKNGGWASWDEVGYYYPKPAIVTYAADGTQTVTKATASYTVPAGVLAVNLAGTGVTSVTKNTEKNCVYILGSSDAVPAGLTNVIRFDGSAYTADNIVLTDDNAFYAPVDFTATKVAFDYAFTTGADGSNGWNTIMLPFDVARVTADGDDIGWFTSSTDEGKQFWLKEFTSDGAATVNFGYVSGTMQANTPYIVAFPGSKWGAKWDLSGKAIQFVGENTTVHKGGISTAKTGGNFRFIGNTMQDNTENIYCINAAGNKFELRATGGSAPFRAYFKPGTFDRELTSLGIGSDDGTTGIRLMDNGQRTMDNGQWYNLNGQRVSKPTKGLYISNGKKVIVN